MSTLYVIRHGQASFGAADYDQLSERGAEQARHLGRWLAARGVRVDRMWVGPRKRQQGTAEHMIAAAEGWLPAPEIAPGLDEYDGEGVMRRVLPELMRSDPEAFAVFGGDPRAVATDPRRFQPVFERVIRRWAAGELAFGEGGPESFAAFRARVRASLEGIMAAAGRGVTVAVVTSGGPTAVACQMALELSDQATIKQSWVVANTGLTELRYRAGELTLVAFNALPHLPADLVTYR
jgi:broad specificity phosphatase PhoE